MSLKRWNGVIEPYPEGIHTERDGTIALKWSNFGWELDFFNRKLTIMYSFGLVLVYEFCINLNTSNDTNMLLSNCCVCVDRLMFRICSRIVLQ